jgi:hypothetical protein
VTRRLPTGGVAGVTVNSADAAPAPVAAEPAAGPADGDAVELLKAQLDARKAEVEEAQALLQQARRQLARNEELSKRGAVGADVLDEARTQVAVEEARLHAREAQVREAAVRLKQAERPGPGPQPAPRPVPGTRTQPAHTDRLPPDLAVPVTTPVPASDAKAPPAANFTGGPGQDVERRLQDLEKKLDGLLREVEALRREMTPSRPGKPGSRVPGDGAPPSTSAPLPTPNAPPGSPPSTTPGR